MEFLVYGLMIAVVVGAVVAVVAFINDEGGVAGRSNNSQVNNSVASSSVATMSASDEGNAHSGVDGYHGGSYDGGYNGSN